MTLLFVFGMIFFIGGFTYLVYQNNLLDKEQADLNNAFGNLLDEISEQLEKMIPENKEEK